MAGYGLSEKADEDFESIYLFGIMNFGLLQADAYADGMVDRFEQLAEQPDLYPAIDHVRPGYRFSVYKSHAIYYRKQSDYVLVVRILRSQDVCAAWQKRHFEREYPSVRTFPLYPLNCYDHSDQYGWRRT